VHSSSALVLVDDPAEDVVAADSSNVQTIGAGEGKLEPEPSVRPGLVVVPDVLGEH
jgi:hypothetical protein